MQGPGQKRDSLCGIRSLGWRGRSSVWSITHAWWKRCRVALYQRDIPGEIFSIVNYGYMNIYDGINFVQLIIL